MPPVEKATNRSPPPDGLPHRHMLEHLTALKGSNLGRSLGFVIADAERILERLALTECPI